MNKFCLTLDLKDDTMLINECNASRFYQFENN